MDEIVEDVSDDEKGKNSDDISKDKLIQLSKKSKSRPKVKTGKAAKN